MRVYPHAQGLTVYLHDIATRKRYEQELHKLKAEHRQAQALAHLGSWELRLRRGELQWSPETCAIFGVEQSPAGDGMEVLRGRVHAEDWPRLVEARQRLCREASGIDVIYRIVRPDGEVRVVHELGALLQGDDDPLVAGCVQDITEQKRAEDVLRETGGELARALEATRLVMDSAPDMIVVLDRGGHFLRVNAASMRLLGYAPDELLGESMTRLIHPDDVASTLAAIADVIAGKSNLNFRNRTISRHGQTLYMQWAGVWSGQSQCMYVVGHDHTDLHRAEDMDDRQRQMLTAIARRRPLPELLASVVDAYEAHHPDSIGAIMLLRDGCMYRAAASRLPPAFSDAIEGLAIGPTVGSCGAAAWRNECVIVADIASDPLWEGYAGLALAHGLRACWSTPIVARDGEVLGTFAVYYAVARAPLESELEGLDTLAVLAGVAVEHDRAFRRLSESEQRFRSLFDQHPDGVFALDLAGRVIRGNPAGLALLGMADAAAAPPLVQRFAEVDRASIREALERAAAGAPDRLDAAALDAGGHGFPAHLVSIPIVVEGLPQGVFVVLQDQRELRRAQQGMAAQLALVSAIADCVGDGLLAVDTEGHPTFVNHTASRLIALPPGRLPGVDELPSGLLAPLREILGGAERGSADDIGLLLQGEGVVDVSYLATPLRLGGHLAGAVIAFRDIAADKAARRALQQRNRFFEMSREVFCIADAASGCFVQVNPAFATLLGYTEQEMLAIPYMELLHPLDRAPTREAIRRQLDSLHQVADLATRMRRADGSYRWLEWNSITGPDGLLYGAARDTTQRRAADQALARAMEDLGIRNRELQEFAYVASHDLQEPLRKIQTFSDRLRTRLATQVDASSLDYMERMARAALRMQALIDDLLAYSRVGTGADNMTSVNLSSLLATVLEDLEIRIREADAGFDIGVLPTIRANAVQMRQLLQNLLANALKFRASGRPCRIAVHARDTGAASDARGRLWELRVEDNGIGFEPSYAERIFSPFQRLHPRNVYEGTGIGLSIVRRIAERHGGTVRAEGYTGQGATFVVTLPSQPRAATVQEHGRDTFIDG
ncbi:MAG: PAS domain S-box protein [Xanthomonadaceae bacterium]|nr:PAS domain S-box protein [Xanthomonadaceae bacterium]